MQCTYRVARRHYGTDHLVSTLNIYSGEEDTVTKLRRTFAGLSLGFGRCNDSDGAPTRESTSVHTVCHHSAVSGVFSKGKWLSLHGCRDKKNHDSALPLVASSRAVLSMPELCRSV